MVTDVWFWCFVRLEENAELLMLSLTANETLKR
jgi:hypothetical protein